MSKKNRLWMRWCGVYMGQLVVIYVWLYILLVVGKFVCENMKRIWYSDDITYVFLKWVEEKQIGIILFVLFSLGLNRG